MNSPNHACTVCTHYLDFCVEKVVKSRLTSSSVVCFIQKAMALSRRVEEIAHKLLVTFSQRLGNVSKVVGILG